MCAGCGPGLPHVARLSARDLEAIRVLASPGNAWRELDAGPASLGAGSRDRRGGHQSCPGASSPAPALTGSVTRWFGLAETADDSSRPEPLRMGLRAPLAELARPARGREHARRSRCAVLAGCRHLSRLCRLSELQRARSAQWRAAYDGNLFRAISNEETGRRQRAGRLPEPVRSLGHSARSPSMHRRRGRARATSTLILGSDGWRPIAKPPKDPKADAELEAAKKLFEQGKFAEAEKAFARDRQGPQGHTTGARPPSTTWPSPSFSAGKYVDAHDSFEKLHADYPATEYLDKLVSREYAIAQLWTRQDDPKAPKDKLLPWYRRFDGRLPIIDTPGYALKALEHVRHNDPTGDSPTTPRSRSPTTT